MLVECRIEMVYYVTAEAIREDEGEPQKEGEADKDRVYPHHPGRRQHDVGPAVRQQQSESDQCGHVQLRRGPPGTGRGGSHP